MPELSRGASELDTRLAEIDRKLRAIQVDLDPGREPAPSRESSAAQEPPAPPVDAEPVHAGPGPAEPGHEEPGETKPGHADPGQEEPGHTEPGQTKPPPRPQRPRGRAGPLAALLQRSARRSPPPPEARPPIEGGASMSSEGGPAHPANDPSPPPSRPDGGSVPPEMHAKLVSAMRDLLDAYGWTLQQLPVAVDFQKPGESQAVALSVGPFVDTTAVRAFESELLRIPGVQEVFLRGYEGEDRAMFDVRLSEPNA